MDIYKNLVLLKGKDKTQEIQHIEFQGGLCLVTFQQKTYNYSRKDIKWMQLKKEIDCEDKDVMMDGFPLNEIDRLLDFGNVCKIIYKNGYSEVCAKSHIGFRKRLRTNDSLKVLFNYYQLAARDISLQGVNGKNLLGDQYEDIINYGKDSVLGSYFMNGMAVKQYKLPERIIYPFGINRSQKIAVENALGSQISIIQGPPGTGKTQTILNIIANIVVQKKSVAVASNNNSAIENIIHKLQKNNVNFIAAELGNYTNKTAFLKSQTGEYPSMNGWEIPAKEIENITERITRLTEELDKRLVDKETCAEIEKELQSLDIEKKYFQEYSKEFEKCEVDITKLRSEQLMALWSEVENQMSTKQLLGFLKKLKLCLTYNFRILKLFKEDSKIVIASLQRQYYATKKSELEKNKKDLEKKLDRYDFEEKFQELQDLSMQWFKFFLFDKYRRHKVRKIFESRDFLLNIKSFLKEYPVVLSTTYSIKKSLGPKCLYDYLIIDEASQVDLITGALALSCAKNVVIVGDLKQLPNVITEKDRKILESHWIDGIDEQYKISSQSLLSAAVKRWKDARMVLLREHYRCNPYIINFCNKKFYDNQLIVMTTDDSSMPALKLIKTPVGNHARGHVNQREIDVIKNEVLPIIIESGERDIGVITPYRDQVEVLRRQLPDCCEVDTVHKFQGREKNIIILSSVLNQIDDFVNDAHMLNVAVSRAVKSLIVVTSGNACNEKTNYGDLSKYIQYNNFEVVDSKSYSVFDMLYKDYAVQRKAFLEKHKRVSEWDSENLLYAVIEKVLCDYSELGCACHVSLSMIIRDLTLFDEREKEYISNPLTHTDFLIFNQLDKSPVLAIEVDGVKFHQEGSKQYERDKIKNSIFEKVQIPLLRIKTNESNEEIRIREKLNK